MGQTMGTHSHSQIHRHDGIMGEEEIKDKLDDRLRVDVVREKRQKP